MLTRKQKEFWENLKEMINRLGYFPTVREMGKEMSLSSPATVHSYLERLRRKGYLKRTGTSWDLASGSPSVPLVGVVPAGSPLEVFESLGEEVALPEWMTDREGDVVAFRVQGESMKDAFIQDGDVVIVKPSSHAENGEMVVALLGDGSITLKRFKRDGTAFWLIPENPDFKPIHDPFQVAGKVIGILRRY